MSTTGRHVRLDNVVPEFPPAVVPPVYAGVRGPKSLAVGGKHADGTILAEPAAPEYVQATRKIVGERHSIVTYNWFALDDDPVRAVERARKDVTSALSAGAEPHLRPLPFGAELIELIGGDRKEAIPPEWIAKLSIAGTLDDCAGQVRALHAAGSESVILLPLLGGPEEDAISAAGELARRAGTGRASGPSPS